MLQPKERRKPGYWTKERVRDAARKHKTRKQLKKHEFGAFTAAKKYEMLDELFPNDTVATSADGKVIITRDTTASRGRAEKAISPEIQKLLSGW